MRRLPQAVQLVIQHQTTLPVAELWNDEPEEQHSAYGSCWYRAVGGMLLSGRVSPKLDDYPNRTDINRICKEANFNQFLFERIAKLLVAAAVTKAERRGQYAEGPNHAPFWAHDAERLPEITRQAVLRFVQEHTGYQPWRPTTVHASHLIEFLTVFFACCQGLAFREDQVGQVWHAFATLPAEDLLRVANGLGLKLAAHQCGGWSHWLDAKGQQALLSALYAAEWASYDERGKTGWVYPSPIGLGMLGLKEVLPAPPLSVELKALPNHCVFTGAGLPMDWLVPLFRYCLVKRIDQVFEFQIDRRRLAEAPPHPAPGEELRQVLRELEPLPATISSLLETKTKLGGVLGIRWCSALVKPENAEVLAAMREHPKLKGYLEAGAPPGYLLIKPMSRPDNFLRRCRELGFEVNAL